MNPTQLPQNDHDAIVALKATNEIGFADIKKDIAGLETSIAKIEGLFTTQFAIHDGRIAVLEKALIQYDPPENIRKIERHELFINDYIATHKERNAIYAFWFSVISVVISIAFGMLKVFFK